ncbi:MAG TPA: cell wall hydrolase [Oscillospiraceae bacterium]|nr:cell wall hydrolase [Oscillospiraceae bacterium]
MRQTRRKRRLAPRGYILLIVVATGLLYLAFGGKSEEQVSTVSEIPVLESPITTQKAEPMMAIEISTPDPTPQCIKPVERYSEITMNDDELDELAEIIYHEARGESVEGQQAVAEVVFNRVIADNFPDTVHEVLHQKKQFSTVRMLNTTEPRQEQYDAINAALYGPTILPADVVFFSRSGENSNIWGSIGGHVFCYQYNWD